MSSPRLPKQKAVRLRARPPLRRRVTSAELAISSKRLRRLAPRCRVSLRRSLQRYVTIALFGLLHRHFSTLSPTDAISSQDANYLKSREARATGQAQPPKDSLSAEAQRLAAANERGATTTTASTTSATSGTTATSGQGLTSEQQSHLTKERNFQRAVDEVGAKMENDPGSVTKEDGDLLHRREQRAHGVTEKGGIAAQAQHLAAENMGATK